MDLLFYFAMKQTYPGPRASLTECRKKAHHTLYFHELIEHLKINKVWLFTWDFIQMVKEKGSEANEIKEMKETEREISKLTLLYNAYCFDKFFILKVNLKTLANLYNSSEGKLSAAAGLPYPQGITQSADTAWWMLACTSGFAHF